MAWCKKHAPLLTALGCLAVFTGIAGHFLATRGTLTSTDRSRSSEPGLLSPGALASAEPVPSSLGQRGHASQVRRTSHAETLATVGAAGAAGQAPPDRLRSLTSNRYTLIVPEDDRPEDIRVAVRLLDNSVESPADGWTLELQSASTTPTPNGTGATSTPGPLTLSPGRKTLKATKGAVTTTVVVYVPNDASPPAAPAITHAAAGKYGDLTELSRPGAQPFRAFRGNAGGADVVYVRLQGYGAADGATISFKVFQVLGEGGSETRKELTSTATTPKTQADGSTWTAELTFKADRDDAKFEVVPLAIAAKKDAADPNHRFGSQTLSLSLAPNRITGLKEPAITKVDPENLKRTPDSEQVTYVNKNSLKLEVTHQADADGAQLVVTDVRGQIFGVADVGKATTTHVPVKGLEHGENRLQVTWWMGDAKGAGSRQTYIRVKQGGFRVAEVTPETFGTAAGTKALRIAFNTPLQHYDDKQKKPEADWFILRRGNGQSTFDQGHDSPANLTADGTPLLNADTFDSVILKYQEVPADFYRLEIASQQILDIYGNQLEGIEGEPGRNYQKVLGGRGAGGGAQRELAGGLPRGIRHRTGQQVDYPEYTDHQSFINGFNPHDHVETRVARLYYYRDAHRVTQIINRTAESFNRQAVAVAEQLAARARGDAEAATGVRQQAERTAIEAARQTREAEAELKAAQQGLANATGMAVAAQADVQRLQADWDRLEQKRVSDRDAANKAAYDLAKSKGEPAPEPKDVLPTPEQIDTQRRLAQQTATVDRANQAAENFQAQIPALQDKIRGLRAAEVRANDQVAQTQFTEDRAREEQFRREVAAAHEDPDTYAEGVPDSDDPVRQCSLSVVGEGLIQIRGPLRGINKIRTMINQLDAPVGQVRVAVHTVQVNGENARRMETVSARIQDYIDHSRFLTVQSAEMLRKAVVAVASRYANQMELEGMPCPPGSQAARDQKYLYAFFGKDFTDELNSMESEFLQTGNKLLALHAMDSTSLASALFILALAKNDVRKEILAEFEEMIATQLPAAEEQYFEAGGSRGCHTKLVLMACNARFQSLKGFFDADVTGTDTLTPIQREFLRLAQIFRSQLITEMELKQRIVERAIIEERLGNYEEVLRERNAERDKLQSQAETAQVALDNAILVAMQQQTQIRGDVLNKLSGWEDEIQKQKQKKNKQKQDQGNGEQAKAHPEEPGAQVNETSEDSAGRWPEDMARFARQLDNAKAITLNSSTEAGTSERWTSPALVENLEVVLEKIRGWLQECSELGYQLNDLLQDLNDGQRRKVAAAKINAILAKLDHYVVEYVRDFPGVNYNDFRNSTSNAVVQALQLDQLADRLRQFNHLDHKKFLDMLIAEYEEKNIELLEGTRAHTANIDNYVKRLVTALDDDFQTQFYLPAFRQVRKASRKWDVTLGQIESTSILANNRAFAKVEPQATMEFDLPKRDILISEAINGAKAVMDDIGALASDPTFLSMTKLFSGQPTSSPAVGTTASMSTVRDVLPGLDAATEEQVLSQGGPGNQRFGTAMEALIPDPAIYKFETGTGYEIRPVIQPDGQAVVFHFNYMYTTNVREPVRADEKHLGRVKRHFIDTDVQTSNFELREVSKYQVALKAARTSQGVPLLQDIPVAGVLFRPLPSAESSLQQNTIFAQSVIFPTLFDLMGLRWAPAVADLDSLRLTNADFVVRGRQRDITNRVFDYSSGKVDEFMQIPPDERRSDLYRTQETIPHQHPNGYRGPGLNLQQSELEEGYDPGSLIPDSQFVPSENGEGAIDGAVEELPPGTSDGPLVPAPTDHGSVAPRRGGGRAPRTVSRTRRPVADPNPLRTDLPPQAYYPPPAPAGPANVPVGAALPPGPASAARRAYYAPPAPRYPATQGTTR